MVYSTNQNVVYEIRCGRLVLLIYCAMTDAGDTRLLVADFVQHRLKKKNMEWSNCPDLRLTPRPVERAMRELGEEFQDRYTQVFQEMCKQLHITPENAEQTFVTTVNELFRDGVKWGRVVALFAFASSLAVECMEKDMPLLVDRVVEWTANYIDTQLKSWIQENGGWNGFVDFYDGHPERREDETQWPSLSTVCGCAIGAIGVLTLGAFFSQKS